MNPLVLATPGDIKSSAIASLIHNSMFQLARHLEYQMLAWVISLGFSQDLYLPHELSSMYSYVDPPYSLRKSSSHIHANTPYNQVTSPPQRSPTSHLSQHTQPSSAASTLPFHGLAPVASSHEFRFTNFASLSFVPNRALQRAWQACIPYSTINRKVMYLQRPTRRVPTFAPRYRRSCV